MSSDEPTATIKITFDDLSNDTKSFAFVLYFLMITLTFYLNVKTLDILASKLYSIYQTRHYHPIE